MKCLNGIIAVGLAFFLVLSTVSVAGAASRKGKAGKYAYSTYDPVHKCQVICKGPTPFLEALESGLAYALDIPLAMLSPITCPIVGPIMDRIDSGPDRTYSPSRKHR
jgi:hypothetical protein